MSKSHKTNIYPLIFIGLLIISSLIVYGLTSDTKYIYPSRNRVLGARIVASPAAVVVKSVNQYPVNASSQTARTSLFVSITNNSASVLQISPGLQMQLIDSLGNAHPMTANYTTPKTIIGGPLGSGKTRAQSFDFDLPSGVKPDKFIFQSDSKTAPIEVKL